MPEFNRRQRENVEVLQQRLEYLRSDRRQADYEAAPGAFTAGEAGALEWALAVIETHVTDDDVVIETLSRRVRKIEARLGRVEVALADEVEFDDDDGEIRVTS